MLQQKKGITFFAFDIFKNIPSLTAAVSTRANGVSPAPFSSLNMSISVGDEPARVIENRRRYFQALNIDPTKVISCNQVHGTRVVAVGKGDCGRGSFMRDDAIAECDGLMTNEDGVPLTMNFADCTPLLFCDPVHHAIAVSHGGWRGTAANIAAVTLERMRDAYGTDAADVVAAIGPAIGPCCFEVGQDVIDAFSRLFTAEELYELARSVGEKYYFDLPKANRWLLLRAGIKTEHLEEAHICTYCRDDLFFSYRKASRQNEKTGRHMAVMMWRGEEDGRV